MNRREALTTMGAGFGTLGLINVLQADSSAGPLAPKAPHFSPKAKRVIFLFLNGGMSHIDTFDPKPMLTKHDGEPMPGPKIQTDRASGNLMRSPFEFRKHGQSGIEVSEIFPRVASLIDDICVIRSMYSDNGNHGPSLLMMNSGHGLTGRPVHGLLDHVRVGHGEPEPAGICRAVSGAIRCWARSYGIRRFLPSVYQGTYIPSGEREPDKLLAEYPQQDVRHARNKGSSCSAGQAESVVSGASGASTGAGGGHPNHGGRVPHADGGAGCVRYLEGERGDAGAVRRRGFRPRLPDGAAAGRNAGLRMVQVYFGNFQPWDSHDDIRIHAKLARCGGRADRGADRRSEGARACSTTRC